MKFKKFVDMYSSIQERNVDAVVIIRVGMFYTVLGINAARIESFVGFKRTCFGNGVCKIGVPKKSVDNLTTALEYGDVKYVIYEYTEDVNSQIAFGNNMYKKVYESEGSSVLPEPKYECDCRDCDYLREVLEKAKSKADMDYSRYLHLNRKYWESHGGING